MSEEKLQGSTPISSASGSCSRRTFLAGATLGIVGGGAAGIAGGWMGRQLLTPSAPPKVSSDSPLAMPGKFRGRVVEVKHPGALGQSKHNGYTERNRDAIKAMMGQGMCQLTGRSDAAEAWKFFFQPGDRVGIKVVPVGRPDSISSYEVILEIIAGLRSAGVRPNDILVFERYRNEFVQTGYHECLPDGVHWEASSAGYDDPQTEIDGQLPGRSRDDHVAGYDPDVFREIPYCLPGLDEKDDRRFRSHLSTIISRKVDKFITVPVLKDHRSSGVTLALKNLSHGLVNNVSRSHIINKRRGNHNERGATLNQCGTFIPAMASLQPTREKAVLHILDGLVGTWEGGPKTDNKTFATWPYQSLLFATDPVALDHIGWEIIDEKRVKEGWPVIAAMGIDATNGHGKIDGKVYPEELHIRQPQHIPLAETLGLGVFERSKIQHRRIDLT